MLDIYSMNKTALKKSVTLCLWKLSYDNDTENMWIILE